MRAPGPQAAPDAAPVGDAWSAGVQPTDPTSAPETQFAHRVARFVEEHTRLWEEVDPTWPDLGETFSQKEQQTHAQQAAAFLRRMEARGKTVPRQGPRREAWRDGLLLETRTFAGQVLGFPDDSVSLMFSAGYRQISAAFLRQARAFDPALEALPLFQAMRNVWIAACLQHLFGRTLVLTPSIFGYSLLYPYTDNPLDDPTVPTTIKQAMGEWLSRRLAGDRAQPTRLSERPIARLLDLIEAEHPRARFPEVHFALQAIHRAQSASFAQQSPGGPTPGLDLARVTIEKGGTSVLADAYLVAGRPQAAQTGFAFGYGVLLQLLDDLQDVQTDAKAGHWTLFSARARGGSLDDLVSRLFNFTTWWIRQNELLGDSHGRTTRDLIQRSVRWMILQAIATHPGRFGPEFAHRMEPFSRLPFAFVREEHHRLDQRSERDAQRIPRHRALDLAIQMLE